MRCFKWEEYLEHFLYIPKKNHEQDKLLSSPANIKLTCEVTENNIPQEYIFNSRALNKDLDIKFSLTLHPTVKPLVHDIRWFIENRGEEATSASTLSFEMEKHRGKYYCNQVTKYNGHHYMICRLYNNRGNLIGEEKFGIYINDETRNFKDLLQTLTISERQLEYGTK